jgi:predicted 3-demethylubiquinone-9 3-methyltransferase (glyoxalase superfamily)
MLQKITTFLMFDGEAEEAMRFYASLFADSEIQSVSRYGPGEAATEGTVQPASFVIADQPFMCLDSAAHHDFAFTPSTSLYVQCNSDAEIERLYGAFRQGGQALMPLDSYGFVPNLVGSETVSASRGS